MGSVRPVRFTTWLAPGLPAALFEAIATAVGRGLGRPHVLTVETRFSGPTCEKDDLFAADETDIGFLCPPSYLWLSDLEPSSVALVPLAPVYDDPRNEGRPVYFSDVVVPADSPVTALADLAGRRIGYNDTASLSGYHGLLGTLRREGLDPRSFAELIPTGSHLRSLAAITSGALDAAAVDAYTWRRWSQVSGGGSGGARGADDRLPLRSAVALGPYPVQPIVVRASAAADLLPTVARILDGLELPDEVRAHGLTGFAPVSTADYEALRPLLAPDGELGPPPPGSVSPPPPSRSRLLSPPSGQRW